MSHYNEWLNVQIVLSSSDMKNSNPLHVSVAIGTFRRQPLSRMDNINALKIPAARQRTPQGTSRAQYGRSVTKKHPSNIASLGSEAKRHERSSTPHHWPAIGLASQKGRWSMKRITAWDLQE